MWCYAQTQMKIDSVQGLRGIAALAVVASHAIGELIEHGHVAASAMPLATALGEGGVRVFFVISGFIMAATMRGSFGEPGAARDFILKRLIRIVPLYWLVTLVYIAVVLAPKGMLPSAGEVAMSLAFLPYVGANGQYWPIYVPGWTLNYEMVFYALFAVALLWRQGLWLVLVALGALAAAGLAYPGFYTSPIILYFAAGIVLARFKVPQGMPPRLSAISNAVGDASYSIYLTHSFVLGISTRVLRHLEGPYAPALWLVAMLAASTVVGMLSYRLLELPMTTWLRGLARPRGSPRWST